jgi:hypothetical protein
MSLDGPYGHLDEKFQFVARVFLANGEYLNEKTEKVVLEEGDILRYFNSGQWGDIGWFALYKPIQ